MANGQWPLTAGTVRLIAGGRLQGTVLGASCMEPPLKSRMPALRVRASYKLEVHGGGGCKAGASPPYIAPDSGTIVRS